MSSRNKKYQIFVSSTYEDLKKERDEVIKGVLEIGHIPVGMEMFSAADDEQWAIIQRTINDCDYYVVIVGHCYGSMAGSKSYTEKEYDYAVSRKIPVLGFIVDKGVPCLPEKIDREQVKIAGLSAFIAKVKKKPVGFWKSAEDLKGKVIVALSKAFNSNPRPGWVRSTTLPGPAVAEEISRLSRERDELRAQVEVRKSVEDRTDEWERLRDKLAKLRFRFETMSRQGARGMELTMLDVFLLAAPQMVGPIDTSSLASKILQAADASGALDLVDGHQDAFRAAFTDLMRSGLFSPSRTDAVSPLKWVLSTTGECFHAYIRGLKPVKMLSVIPDSK